MKLVSSILMILTALFVTQRLYSGSSAGNGADDLLPSHGSGWFIGETNTVQACFEREQKFQVSSEVLKARITSAFNNWSEYYRAKHVSDYVDAQHRFTFKFNLTEGCHGREDLRIYFGGNNEEVKESLGQFDRPWAFAKQTEFSSSAGWGKGFIWVNENPASRYPVKWNSPYALEAIMMHELGHVYGCEHVRGTIMDEDLVKYIGSGEERMAAQIDQTEELLLCAGCAFDYQNEMGITEMSAQESFGLLVGRLPKGPVKSRLYRAGHEEVGTFEVVDDLGLYSFNLKLNGVLAQSHGQKVFSATKGANVSPRQAGLSFSATTTSMKGSSISMVVNRNLGYAAAEVSIFNREGRLVSILQTTPSLLRGLRVKR